MERYPTLLQPLFLHSTIKITTSDSRPLSGAVLSTRFEPPNNRSYCDELDFLYPDLEGGLHPALRAHLSCYTE